MKEESSVKKYLIVIGIITFMALTLRLIAGWQMYNSVPAVQNPSDQTDMHTYMEYAQKLTEGKYTAHDGAYYYQPFYYAVFLRLIFTLFGSDPLSIVIIQAFLGAATVFLTGVIGARLGGKKAGIIAALILTLFRNHILYTPFALIAILQTFLITLSIYLVLRAFDKRKWQNWVYVGLVMSCSILSRGNLLLLVPFIVFFIWRVHRPGWKGILVPITAFLLAVYLPQMPFSVKNYSVTGKWTGPSTAGDIVLSIGNNPDAPPGTEGLPLTHYITYSEYDEVHHWQANKETPLKSQVTDWIKSKPVEWLELKFRTFTLFFSNNECYNNTTLAKCVRYVPWLNSYILLDFWIVGIPFLVLTIRTLLARKFTKRKVNFLLVAIAVYSLGVIAFYVLSRYKLPIVPAMAICAGMEYVRWINRINGKKAQAKLLLAVNFLFSMFVVLKLFDVYRSSIEPVLSKSLHPNGRIFETEKAVYIKDNGPILWGEWKPFLFDNEIFVAKKFKTLKEISSKGLMRFYCGAKGPSVIHVSLRHAGRLYAKSHTFPRAGGTWLEIPMDKIVSEDHEINLEIEVKTLNAVGVFFTPQRNYGRSLINGQALDGEWIIQLKIDK